MPIRLAINGALGRMGRRITALAIPDERFEIVALLEAAGHPGLGSDPEGAGVVATATLEVAADVCVDFSVPAATRARLPECRARRVAMVVGTTGLGDADRSGIAEAGRDIAVLYARNMSTGIATLLLSLPEVIKRFGAGTTCEIVETHHDRKVDAPSGTALALAEVCAEALGTSMDKATYGRHGEVGARPADEIGIHAVRGGDVPGVHSVQLFNGSESIEIVHRAGSRDIFAAGALRAAAFVNGRPNGEYGILDVVREGA